MKVKTSFVETIKNIIFKDSNIGHFYKLTHPNSKYSLSLIIHEILFVLKTGIAWRNLRSIANWRSIYFHFKRFVRYNIFDKLFKHVRNNFPRFGKVFAIDTTFITNKYGRNKIARNKFFKNKNCIKISAVCDINGVPLSVFVNKGTVHDLSFTNFHIKDIRFPQKSIMLADKGYVSNKFRDQLNKHQCTLMVKNKKNMANKYPFSKILYKRRIRIENFFQTLKTFRRVQIRYDIKHSTFKSFVYLAFSSIIYKKL